MKTQYTPGPWHVNQSELQACSPLCEIRGKGGAYVITRDVGYQNARLIASAPQLLEALEALLAHEGSPMQAPHKGRCFSFVIPEQAVASARAAINAAKGETL